VSDVRLLEGVQVVRPNGLVEGLGLPASPVSVWQGDAFLITLKISKSTLHYMIMAPGAHSLAIDR
jgi:hypothetical protein